MTITETILIIALGAVVAAWLLREVVRHRQARRLRALAAEAEESKQQIIVEQRRNRQLKQEMTNNIAHELKTPVSSIRGYLEILLGDKPVSDERRRWFLERCYSQTLRLSDLIADGNSKAAGMQAIIDHFGIRQQDTIAFGDGDNDIEMLEFAGIGVAMGNATPEVKAAADVITEDNGHDGVAVFLEKLLES